MTEIAPRRPLMTIHDPTTTPERVEVKIRLPHEQWVMLQRLKVTTGDTFGVSVEKALAAYIETLRAERDA